MRTDLIREINYIKMCENIKPNFSALARTYKTSRNTVKKYYYAKEEAFISRDRFALELYHIGRGLRYIMGHAEKRPETKRKIRRKLAEQLTIFNS